MNKFFLLCLLKDRNEEKFPERVTRASVSSTDRSGVTITAVQCTQVSRTQLEPQDALTATIQLIHGMSVSTFQRNFLCWTISMSIIAQNSCSFNIEGKTTSSTIDESAPIHNLQKLLYFHTTRPIFLFPEFLLYSNSDGNRQKAEGVREDPGRNQTQEKAGSTQP